MTQEGGVQVYFNPDPDILWTFLGVLAIITLNAALGVLRAVVDQEFDIEHMADYLRTHILPDGGALILLGATAVVTPEVKVLFFTASAAATLKYLGKIKENLAKKHLIEPD